MVNANQWLAEVWRTHVLGVILRDPRETGALDTKLGYPIDWIYKNVLDRGLSASDLSSGQISARDKVLLYALLSQRQHIAELEQLMRSFLPDPEALRGATIVDFGSGPFTAGLAIASIVGCHSPLRYFGIDKSPAIRDFGIELAIAAVAARGLDTRAKVIYCENVERIDFERPRASLSVIVVSALFSDQEEEVEKLCEQVVKVSNRIGTGPCVVIYASTGKSRHKSNLEKFEIGLARAGFVKKAEADRNLNANGRNREVRSAFFARALQRESPHKTSVLKATPFGRKA